MFYALHQALALISEEGLEQRWKRHHDSHKDFVNRIEALGLQMHVAEDHRIWNLNTPRVPEGLNDAAVRKALLDQDGIEILGGFGQLAGKIFRIGVMGPLATPGNLDFFFGRFSKALAVAGYKAPASVGYTP
jgi:alanine-glyoxylate transaminase/serine-glyoxylate transaminase/serine-pyruvate transaminase